MVSRKSGFICNRKPHTFRSKLAETNFSAKNPPKFIILRKHHSSDKSSIFCIDKTSIIDKYTSVQSPVKHIASSLKSQLIDTTIWPLLLYILSRDCCTIAVLCRNAIPEPRFKKFFRHWLYLFEIEFSLDWCLIWFSL